MEVWPTLGADQVEEPDDWTLPVNHASAPAVRVAEHVAATIKGWLDKGEILKARAAPCAPATFWCWCASDRFHPCAQKSPLEGKGRAGGRRGQAQPARPI